MLEFFTLRLGIITVFVSRVGVFVDDVGRCDVDVLRLGRSWFREELRFLLV